MKDKAGSCLHLTVCNCATWTGGGRGATGADHAAGAPLVCLTSGTTGAGAKGELPALSSGPEALSSKVLNQQLRALSDFEAVR